MATRGRKESVEVDGRTIRFTHPDKVLYEATGTTKADVLEYYLAVAPLLLTYAGRRPVTRKRLARRHRRQVLLREEPPFPGRGTGPTSHSSGPSAPR